MNISRICAAKGASAARSTSAAPVVFTIKPFKSAKIGQSGLA
jgi:hypothetical protein